MRQAERAVMHGNHPARLEIEESFGCIRRIRVHIAELRRIVGSNRKQREFGRKTTSDFAEAGEVRRIACVIDRMLAIFQDEASITTMRILQNSRTPMTRWDVRYSQVSQPRMLPPVEFDNF